MLGSESVLSVPMISSVGIGFSVGNLFSVREDRDVMCSRPRPPSLLPLRAWSASFACSSGSEPQRTYKYFQLFPVKLGGPTATPFDVTRTLEQDGARANKLMAKSSNALVGGSQVHEKSTRVHQGDDWSRLVEDGSFIHFEKCVQGAMLNNANNLDVLKKLLWWSSGFLRRMNRIEQRVWLLDHVVSLMVGVRGHQENRQCNWWCADDGEQHS